MLLQVFKVHLTKRCAARNVNFIYLYVIHGLKKRHNFYFVISVCCHQTLLIFGIHIPRNL